MKYHHLFTILGATSMTMEVALTIFSLSRCPGDPSVPPTEARPAAKPPLAVKPPGVTLAEKEAAPVAQSLVIWGYPHFRKPPYLNMYMTIDSEIL